MIKTIEKKLRNLNLFVCFWILVFITMTVTLVDVAIHDDHKKPQTPTTNLTFHYEDSVCFENDFYVRCCGFVESRREPDVYKVDIYRCNGSSIYNFTPLIRGNDLKHVEEKDW